jgi:hypothetical protein
LLPASLAAAWPKTDATAPTLEFDFRSQAGDAEVWLDFLPTFRLVPGVKLRVAVAVDDREPSIVEVPGSGGDENEYGRNRSQAVQDNYVRARVPVSVLVAGQHTLRIRALDPGVVIDRVALP